MASTVWKGYLTFGLVSIPIRLFTAARGERVDLNMLHKECGSRIKQQTYCPTCDRTIERGETVKGYQYSKDRYVILENEELEKLSPSSAQNMDILQFVKTEEIDPIYLDASYYTVPDGPGAKAYKLLYETMRSRGYSAVAKLTMHQREYTAVIRPYGKGLALHTIYYASEVREVSEYGSIPEAEVKPQEVQLAEALVDSLAGPFNAQQFQDEYQVRLKRLIEAKREGLAAPEEEAPRLAPVIDLMEALKKSLANVQRKPPVMETAVEAAGEAKPKKAARRKVAAM